MRILIGNHIDPAIRERGDMRAWTQRIVWFAREGDLIVLSDMPDERFLRYATSLTGVNPDMLRILVAPAGPHARRLLDPDTLTEAEFLRTVRTVLDEVGRNQVEDIFALWPSAHVSRFAAALGIEHRFPGAGFCAQDGGEVANNKATFRALAAGSGVPIPEGRVCRSRTGAVTATEDLLTRSGAVVVKQAHNGAGVGNQLVSRDPSLASDHVGARHIHQLDNGDPHAIEAYWSQRWDWASAQNRFPVVVEEFTPHTVSVYSEHYAADDAARPTEMGTLHYVGRRLSHQVVPLRGVKESTRGQLLQGGARLAETYRTVGYRGHLSADAVVTTDGRVVFTEVNAQVSGSLHIYQVIAHHIVDVTAAPERFVVEYHVPPTWAVADFDTFLTVVDDLGCAYDPATRTGVIVSMPAVPLETGRAQFVFCIAYGTDRDRHAMFDRLDSRFATVAADTSTPSDHIGVPRHSVS